MLDVCLLGTGGMMPLPNRWLTALMTRYNGSHLMIDCGEGSQITLKQKGWGFKQIDIICITHFHADHISGLPGMLLAMANANREEPLLMIGPKGLERVVNALRVIAPTLSFDIQFIELTDKASEIRAKGYRIEAFKLNHGITCYGYTINIDRQGKFYQEKAKQKGIPIKYWSRLQNGETIEDENGRYLPEDVLGEARRGIKVTYCTDTRPTQSIIDYGKEADLLICEGMYGGPVELTNARAYKHMTFAEAATLAKRAEVKMLWLTHFSPAVVNPKEFLGEATAIFKQTIVPRDRRSVTLKFSDE